MVKPTVYVSVGGWVVSGVEKIMAATYIMAVRMTAR